MITVKKANFVKIAWATKICSRFIVTMMRLRRIYYIIYYFFLLNDKQTLPGNYLKNLLRISLKRTVVSNSRTLNAYFSKTDKICGQIFLPTFTVVMQLVSKCFTIPTRITMGYRDRSTVFKSSN